MKAPRIQRYPVQSKKLFTAILAFSGSAGIISSVAHAASGTWLGTTDSLWSDVTNWSASPVPGAGEIATFNGAGNGNTTIDLGTGVSIGSVVFDTSSAAAYTIGSGAVGSQTLTLGSTLGNVITMSSGVAANQVFNSNLALSVSSTANNQATYYALTNDSPTNTLTIAGGISASTTGVKTLRVTGTGNTNISGAITSGSGNVSIFKTGSGTLTLSGGAIWSGAGITDGSNFTTSAVFREGTTILNGGTYGNSNGELVVGGVATNGGAGANSTLQLENGTILNNISWLSIGRGNGNGTATSNLTLNGNASISATNMSAGFNAGNGGNVPKGTITLNGTSSLTLSTNFQLGESAGSDFTMTLNDSSSVTVGGGLIYVGNQNGKGTLNLNSGTTFTTNGEIRVAYSGSNGTFNGTGTINVDGGTVSTRALTVGRNNNDVASTLNGTVNVTAGALNVRDQQSLIGWRGIGTSGTVNISGGSYNQGTTATANMAIGTFSGTNAAVNVSGTGALTLQRNSNILFSNATGTNASTRTLTISAGNVTFYSDAGTTVGGTGYIDLMNTANASSVNTINLDGGALTANQIRATSATGTRVINFNGGTLKAAGDGYAATFLASGVATRANVRNGGAVIDTNGFNVTIGQALEHSNVGGDNATDGGLTKLGSGTLTLNGANTYTGLTTISAGTLALGASGSVAGGINLGTAGSQGILDLTAKASNTLFNDISGYGTINVGTGNTVTLAGNFGPGNSAGIVNVTGNLALAVESTTTMELLGRNGGSPVAGVDFDQAIVSGSVSFGGTFSIDTTGLSGLVAGDSFTLFSSGVSSYGGNFDSLSIGGAYVASMSYNAGSDIWSGVDSLNNLAFTFNETNGVFAVNAVPEPSTFAAFAGLAGLGFAASRRRRRVAV